MPAELTAEEQRILATFSGRIAPVSIAPGYGLALGSVAILMVLLPLLYLGIVGAVAWGWWWYAQHGMELVGGGSGRGSSRNALFLYLSPLVIGGVLVVFMFKPLFARPPKGAKPLSLDERREPFLFTFIRRLCEAVGAPVPRRIDITCEVNASASFRRGTLSMLGNDLVLTIGLPLVAGQNLRQFTGVLAHEFGHFAQGWAMRANYVIRTVNHWFARVVYQRDAMDEWLVKAAKSDSHWAINVVFHVARLFVWLTRRVLWLLMMVGHLFSSLLSRQMEFDADRHACRLVGREPFASALRELPVLGAAESGAHQDLGNAWREKRLADDLPKLIRANVEQIKPELRERLIADGLGQAAGMYASHPATRDRIAAGGREPQAGVFGGIDAPAQVLFRDFARLCCDATLSWYKHEAGLPVQTSNLVPTGELVAAYERDVAASRAAERILGKLWSGAALFAPAGEPEDGDREALAAEAKAAEDQIVELRRGKALAAAGVEKRSHAVDAMAQAVTRRTAARERLGRAAAAAARRLAHAAGDEAERLRACLAALAPQQAALDEVRDGFLTLAEVLDHLDAHREDEQFIAQLRTLMGAQRLALIRLRDALKQQPYPFDHHQQGIAVGDYLLAAVPGADDLGGLMNGSQEMLRNLYGLHHRALARLAALVDQPAG